MSSGNQSIRAPVIAGWLASISEFLVSPALRRRNGENGFVDRLLLGSQVRPLLTGLFLLVRNAKMRDFKVENIERRGTRRPLLDQEALR